MKFYDYETYIVKLAPIYKELFEGLSDLLPQARIEHIGASSTQGCISKGDLDVLVAVNKDRFKVSLEKIKSLGFYEKKNTLRTHELCMLKKPFQTEDEIKKYKNDKHHLKKAV